MSSTERIERLYTCYTAHPTVCTDSRRITPGCLFFALRGANFDGNRFAAAALAQGAALAVTDDPAVLPVGTTDPEALLAAGYFPVENTLKALQQLASLHRRRLGIPILAITGTNGKTTTKELTTAVMSTRFTVHATVGNLNNHIGVPLTLLAMTPETTFGIVEMGASAPGEIAALCRIARPNYGLITNVGRAHLAGFGGEAGVRATKGELYDWLAATGGRAFVRTDDPVLASMAAERPALQTLPYDSSAADGLESRLAGDYNRFNIAAAAAVGRHFGIPEETLRQAIRDYVPSLNRSQVIARPDRTLIVDCYNANPSSMQAALEWFAREAGNAADKAVILGDMLELGAWSEAEHRNVLDRVMALRPGTALLIGPEFGRLAAEALSRCPASTRLRFFPDTDAAARAIADEHLLEHARTIFLKGSRGMALEKLLPLL